VRYEARECGHTVAANVKYTLVACNRFDEEKVGRGALFRANLQRIAHEICASNVDLEAWQGIGAGDAVTVSLVAARGAAEAVLACANARVKVTNAPV
jgi:hypothetical protein